MWSKLENVRDSTIQTVAWVTHQERGHRFPAGLSAHPLQLAVAEQSIQPAVAIYALWRSEGERVLTSAETRLHERVMGLAQVICSMELQRITLSAIR